ncbi:unnamed protein product [Amoebophrya sp. A120]|nr:unnamed protein product [Amoebophrya sp. A120]|eukprot:GSA120T00017372001.1
MPDANGQAKQEVAVLKLPDGKEHSIKVYRGTEGTEMFLDIRDLYAKTNAFTYDPGFSCTASCSSSITFIDGNEGICCYRGIPIEELCVKSNFIEVAFLLMTGELPNRNELKEFQKEIKANLLVHEKLKRMFESFRMDAHPMAIMVAVTGALSAFFSELDQSDPEFRWLATIRMVAKFPTLAALAYKTHLGEPAVWPQAKMGFAENFLHMMFATPLEEYKVNPIHAKAIDVFLILHADHEQNASTSTVRIAGSSQANPYACVAAGIASLWGPAHGGANEAVIKMFEEIGHKENIPTFLEKVKRKETRLMGFGHRVYKNFDPRAQQMHKLCHQVLNDLDVLDPHLELAMELERIALSDEYFKKRKLYPNVDFYSGIILRAIGIPTSMFTVMFAMARCVGWCSHWLEMHQEDQMRIGRPRQLYVGSTRREFVPMQERPGYADSPTEGESRASSKSVPGGGQNFMLEPHHPLAAASPGNASGARISEFIQGLARRESVTTSSFKKSVPDDTGASARKARTSESKTMSPRNQPLGSVEERKSQEQ